MKPVIYITPEGSANVKPQEDKLIKLTLEQMYDFVQWYSGMDRLKIMAAYTRYLKESTKRG